MQQVALGKAMQNSSWISDDDTLDPDILPELPGYHVLVRPISIKEKTKGGILLPGSVKDDISYLTTVGRVLKIGNLAYKDKEKFPAGAWCKEDDYNFNIYKQRNIHRIINLILWDTLQKFQTE